MQTRLLRIVTALLLSLVPTTARSAPIAETAFAANVQGCWESMSWPAELQQRIKEQKYVRVSIVCFEGNVRGVANWTACDGEYGLADCWEDGGLYELKDGKLRLFAEVGDKGTTCDAEVLPDVSFKVYNCTDEAVDAIYELTNSPA